MKKRLAYSPGRLVAILTFGVFGIINTEMGVVGIIPQIAETFGVTVPQAVSYTHLTLPTKLEV